AVAVQRATPERNVGLGAEDRIELRIGINLGDVIVEGDDLYATASTSRRASKHWPMPAGCSSPIRFKTMFATGCPLSLRIWGGRRSRTLRGRCGSTGCDLNAPSLALPRRRGRKARIAQEWGLPSRRCRFLPSRRSRYCRLPI